MFQGSFVEWLESNVVSLVLAILLALVVWTVATQELNPAVDLDFNQPIPVQYIGPDDGYIVTNEPPETATVRVHAPSDAVRELTRNDFIVVADLTGLTSGEHTVELEARVADGVQAVLLAVRPATVVVELEELAVRELPIQLVQNGELPVGYRAGVVSIEPSMATIRGPASAVQLVSEVRVSVDVTDVREPINDELTLLPLDSEGEIVEGVTVEPGTVQVNIPVFQEADFREVTVVPSIAELETPRGYFVTNIRVEPPIVPIRGDPDVLQNINSIETEPIRLTAVQSDQTFVAQLVPPQGVTLEGVRTVTVYISIEAQLGFDNMEVPIEVVGLEEGLEATVAPERVVVSLRGPLPVLERLRPENIVITVDVTDLDPGTHRLEPEAEIISTDIPQEELSRVRVESVLPTVVQVEVMEEEATEGTSGRPYG